MPEIIVVGVDGTETAARAAEQALRLAQGFGATLHVVTAYEGNKASLHGANYERGRCTAKQRDRRAVPHMHDLDLRAAGRLREGPLDLHARRHTSDMSKPYASRRAR